MEQYIHSLGMGLSSTTPHHRSVQSSLQQYLTPAGLFSLGEACIQGKVDPHDIEHTIIALIREGGIPSHFNLTSLLTYFRVLFKNRQQGDHAVEVAHAHYDLGNNLFARMLDKSMSYTCGYWKECATLEEAQEAKLDILCKKLNLEPGMRVLDIGCGWGNFAYHAATHYGVTVTGLTVSKEQAAFARERCGKLPVEILLQSYESYRGSFDRVVSIEMIEAVGKRNLKKFFSFIHRSLQPGGIAVLQAISTESFSVRSHRAMDQFLMWLMKHIFPNGYVPNLQELTVAHRSGLIVEDIENLSTDYEKTLRVWRDNFIRTWPEIRSSYGDSFYPKWLYYLGGCIALFHLRMVQLYQIVYAKDGVAGGYRRI